MSAPSATLLEATRQQESDAAYERWIQAELTGDPRLTALRILYNDLRDFGEVRAETWDYFDLQEKTGGAESMDTQHITLLTGEYDPQNDEIVAAVAGSERVTYDALTVSGLDRAKKRAENHHDFEFQVVRDQIYHDNYHGVVKNMWRGETDYDTVMYVSAFPQDVIDQLGDQGRMILQELAYDTQNFKGFINVFRKDADGNLEFAAARVGNALPENFAKYLQNHDLDVSDLDSHQYGSRVITAKTKGKSLKEVATDEVAEFDRAIFQLSGRQHHFGREQSGADAYELFKQCPKIWGAYREYHALLAQHFNGAPLSTELYDYLVSTHDAVAFHVLDAREMERLTRQLDNQKVTADMALACKKIMTYAHYATINRLLDDYQRTGVIVDIEGDDLMLAYGIAAGDSGGDAAARGETFNDCDMVYGETASNAALDLAARQGITIEEALRRLTQKSERWSDGQCRNCERETQVWKVEHGGCNICKTCADAHTRFKERGLKEEREKAQAEREQDLTDHADLYKAAEEPEEGGSQDDIAVGETRYVDGQKQIAMRWISTGSATTVWVDANTGRYIDDAL
ncbi:MAG TPA: hypothetical protein VM581_04080 [Magnetospirillaceae bacterium]|nr:hypothetical protein [Magnetospirillaceae bacterium]